MNAPSPQPTVERLQRHLERIYEVPVEHRAADFLITDRDLARRLDRSARPRDLPEKLLVREEDGEMELALYLDAGVLDRLAGDDPLERLHEDNLQDFVLALEGVSHFLYLVWSAGHRKDVSLLELELQAEVDKYVSALTLLARQGRGRVPRRLHGRLFDNPDFDTDLDEEGRERYRHAHRWAGRYCLGLERRHLGRRPSGGLLTELRRFYRLPRQMKIARAGSA